MICGTGVMGAVVVQALFEREAGAAVYDGSRSANAVGAHHLVQKPFSTGQKFSNISNNVRFCLYADWLSSL